MRCAFVSGILAAIAVMGSGIPAGAQNQGTAGQLRSVEDTIAFEVASVRVNKSGQLAMPSRTKGMMYRATNILRC
jgi:hypothetical protein